MPETIVFTDLDGSLLDHATYSYDAAKPALNALAEHDIPVVPVSSKTRSELTRIMRDIGLTGPAIAENGAVIMHQNGTIDRAADITDMRAAINALPDNIRRRMRCFGDMSIDEIATSTGLDSEAAAQAARREASEPFIWAQAESSEIPIELQVDFLQADTELVASGYRITRGGRFFHVIATRDKADAMQQLLAATAPTGTQSWALGDGQNDVNMLMAATRGALIANPALQQAVRLPPGHRLYLTRKPGPEGWREAIEAFLAPKLS